jgi:hypothetical protein
MRTTLFLSTLFAASLVGGVALADRPIDRIDHRSHGDQLDKIHAQDARPSLSQFEHGGRTVTNAQTENVMAKQRFAHQGESRVNCSADGADCAASHGIAQHSRSSLVSSTSAKAGKSMAQNKYSNGTKGGDGGGGDSETCSEADQCSTSTKAANSIWASNGASKGVHGSTTAMAAPGSVSRQLQQRLAVAASPEDVQDTPSSDDAKKIWNMESVKKGTFTGPKELDRNSQEHRAAARLSEMKGTRSASPSEKNEKANTPSVKNSEKDER